MACSSEEQCQLWFHSVKDVKMFGAEMSQARLFNIKLGLASIGSIFFYLL